MNRLDFDAINALLDAGKVVPQWLPDGEKQGHEWVARNPTRNDTHPGSFAVNLVTGKWADFATGDEGGDLVSLYAYLFHANDNGKAARELADREGIQLDAGTRQEAAEKIRQIKDHQPKVITPVPDDAPEPNINHFKHGQPSRIWPYYDTQGRLLLFVCRFDHQDGSKDVMPFSWCEHPGKGARWTWRGITGNAKRPLYGQDRLAAMPDADVVLVEGEKAADAGQELLGDGAAVVSWLGGTSTADKVALTALRGRRVILWPDFDSKAYKDNHPRAGELMDLHEQPGTKAMLALARGLAGIAREVLMVGYQVGGKFPDTWDLADAQADGWQQVNVMQYMGLHAGDPFHIAGALQQDEPAEQPDQAEPEAPAPANDNQEPRKLPLDAKVNPFGFPHLTDKGQPLNTVENLAYMLDQYGIRCRYNQVSKQVEVTVPGARYTADNAGNCAMAELTSLCARNRMPKSDLDAYVKLLADGCSFNPVADWITSKPWDGTSRLADLFATVQADMDTTLKDALIYRWLLSAVAATFKQRGFSSHGVLVFTGKQGQGKTAWVKSLVPDDLNVVLEGAVIDPNNKDTIINAVSHWLVELGELDATFRKTDIARLKSFVTTARDKLRQPYDRKPSEYQRRTVFFASVNEDRYLVDDTGNRRWWSVPATAVNYQHQLDMQQVWAELLTHYERGEQWWLTADEQDALNQLNTEHEPVDPVEEMVLQHFDWDRAGMGDDMTASEVLVAIGFDRPNRDQATHASKVLRKLTGTKPHRTGKGRFFKMPPKITQAGRYTPYGDMPF